MSETFIAGGPGQGYGANPAAAFGGNGGGYGGGSTGFGGAFGPIETISPNDI